MAKMKAKQRNALPKKVFGIPAKRKFPLNDEAHVKAAVRLFGRASDADKPALARKILSRAKTLGMDSSGWKKVHEWANKSSTVKESALIGFEHYFEESETLLIPDEDITIRKATKDDLDFIVEMELSTFSEKTKSHYPGIPEYCKRDAKKYLDSTEIIMDDDERIGIYMAYMDGDTWFISSIALLPEYQNRGIGSALIQHDIDTHDKIQLYVDIYNDKAKKLYEKLGFRVIEHDDDHWIMELDKKNNIKLVDATKDDIDYIYECELQTISADEKKDPDFRDEVRKDAEDSVDHTKIIMLNDTRVGIYQAYVTNKWGLEEGEKDWWYIAEIYLSPSARGKGIGTSLIQSDISDHDKLLLNVLKENKKAIKLYKRLGFKIDKEFDNRYIMRLVKSTFQEYSDVVFETVNVGQMNPEQKARHEARKMDKTALRNAKKVGYDLNNKEYKAEKQALANRLLSDPERPEYIKHLSDARKRLADVEARLALLKQNPDNLDPATLQHRIRRFENQRQMILQGIDFDERHLNPHPNPLLQPGYEIGKNDSNSIDATGRRHHYYTTTGSEDSIQYDPSHYFDLNVSPDTLQGKADFDVIHNHEVGHMAQMTYSPTKLDDYILKCAKTFIEKNKSKLDEHDVNPKELHADYLSAKKVGFNRVYKQLMNQYPGVDKTNPHVISSRYRALFIQDMMWLHKGRPDRCSMKYPAWTPEVKKAFMEYVIDDTYGCIQETAHTQIGYRFTYDGEGIYEAFKKAMFKKTNSSSAWIRFKNSTACTWLPVPPQYKGDDELNSYFTEEGRDKFKKLTVPYMKHYLDSDKIKEDKVDISSMEVVYSDEYQYVVKVFNLTVSYIKEAIKKIHDKTEKDSKPPTGNQNCQICTWCLEAQCRGIDVVPRAVYSPRDKGLAIYGPSIVIDPYKIRITDRNDVYDTVRKAGKGARFWVHVNWNQSTGGHEFMLINIDSKTYIADAQAGSLIEFGPEPKDVETLRTTKDYFYEINFAHSYIVRLDNKKLNKKILDEATDESKTLPWDEKKDVEYMRREGLLTGEDEEHAKKTGLITEQFIEEAYRDEHHNKLYFHLSPDSYLDGQVFKPRVPEYLDRYDPEDKNFENDTTPRVCLSPSIEGCLNAIMVNMPRVNVMPAKSTRFYVYIPEKPFHEYKHKTNKELIRDKDIFDASVTDEVWILEPVRMKLYGVIEIDSVTNVKRKQNVPTASGNKSTRPYYKYKWHWLVKPKVLEKGTKFDYSVPRVIENLCMELPKFKYGLIRDGRLQSGNVSESDYNKYWVVHTPEEIDEAGGGNCWDMVEWEAGYLESYGVKYNKYFLSMEHDKKVRTHTFIVVKDHGKFIYIEQAFKRVVDEIGNSKEFDKLEDIFDYVIETSMEFDNMKECNYGIWDYTDIKFKVGTPTKNFMDYIITNGENVYEGNKSNRKKDDFK